MKKGQYQKRTIDDFNDDTFGIEASNNVHEEFIFKSSPMTTIPQRDAAPTMPFFDSAILHLSASPRPQASFSNPPAVSTANSLANDGEDDALPPGMAPGHRPHTISPVGSAGMKILTVAEIEAQLSKSIIDEPGIYFPIHNRKPAIITFPADPRDYMEYVDDESDGLGDSAGEDDNENGGGHGETRFRQKTVILPSAMGLCHLGRKPPVWAQSGLETPTASTLGSTALDHRRGMMTRYEREGIARIHLSQLTTENPDIEDFYYKSYAKRVSRRRPAGGTTADQAPNLLYLPLPTPRRPAPSSGNISSNTPINSKEAKRREKEEREKEKFKEALSHALGKINTSSSRKPRQQLQVPSSLPITQSGNDKTLTATRFSVNSSIERIFAAVFAIEDALLPKDVQEGDAGGLDLDLIASKRRVAADLIFDEFLLRSESEEGIARLLAILGGSKGKKAVGRALKVIDCVELSVCFLERLLQSLEYLDVCRPDANEVEISLFINSLLSGIVPSVAKMDSIQIINLLRILCSKASIPWIVTTKAGLVVCCVLLSRMEIIKGSLGKDLSEEGSVFEPSSSVVPGSPSWMDSFYELVASFYDSISDRLNDIFGHVGNGDNDFYAWQFLALLALNLMDADRKRQIVMEVRERILLVAQQGEPKSISNLNIFLNALGLDASQLA